MDESRKRLERARELLFEHTAEALALYDRVIADAADTTWSAAHLDLARHFSGQADYRRSAAHARAVLEASEPRADAAARADAGIWLVSTQSMLREKEDEALLRTSSEACVLTGQPHSAASGFAILGRLRWDLGDRPAGYEHLERALELYAACGDHNNVAAACKRLATYALEDGDTERALRYIDRGLAALGAVPLLLGTGRLYLSQLEQLRTKCRPSAT